MAAKQYKDHASVPKKYKWDLTFLLEGKTIDERIDEYIKLLKKTVKDKDSKYESADAYLKSLKNDDKNTVKFYKIRNYLENSLELNVVDADIKAAQSKLDFETYQVEQQLGSEDTRFFANAKNIAKWAKAPAFKGYKRMLEAKLEEKKHQLPKAIQEFRLQESRADGNFEDIFSILTNSELDYGFATTTDGKKIKVTPANRSKLSKHKDAKVRKTAAISFRNAYLKHKETLANLLFQHFKGITTWAKLEKFDNTIDSLMFDERVDQKLLKALYQSVQDNMPMFRKADKWHKKFYKAKYGKTMTKYDRSMDLVKTKGEYTPEDAMKLVVAATKPFGKEYNDKVKEAFANNWVDFMQVKNKQSGAFSIDYTYGLSKVLLSLNFDGTFRSVETLAHEIGHSIHTYFADSRNNLPNSEYPIFVAEIASIFNELMLFDHVLNTTDDDKLKFEIRQAMVEGFEGTVLRQVEWSNYEYDMYTGIEEGKSLSTYDAISKVYYENSQKYAVNPKPYKPENQFASVYVPHFYYKFYVYKYAIGQLGANIFFQKYKEEGPQALQNYIEKFLSRGNQDWPVQLLREAGVDLEDPETYKLGFKAAEDNLEEWIKLGKKIFKIK